MRVRNIGDRVSWSHHQRGKHSHGPGQDRRDYGVAHASQETAVAVVLRLHQFLLTFHQRIQQGHQTHDAVNSHGNGG